MKKLNETPRIEQPSPTIRDELMNEIYDVLKDIDQVAYDKIHTILFKYDITKPDLTSVIVEVPDVTEGDTISIILQDKDWNFHGEVISVLYRDTVYPYSVFDELLSNPNMSTEQAEMLKYTIYEAVKPNLYHRIVINDQKQGIMIVPYLKGIEIVKEQ